MLDSDCKALLKVLQTFIGFGPNHDPRDLADLFDLLGWLEPADKAISGGGSERITHRFGTG